MSSAFDDGANFAIAQGIRSELRGIEAISQGLGEGIGEVVVAGTTMSNLLQDICSKLTELSNEGITTQHGPSDHDFNELLSQAANFLRIVVQRREPDRLRRDAITLVEPDGRHLTLTAVSFGVALVRWPPPV